MPSARPFGWLLVIGLISAPALSVNAETANPSISEDVAEVSRLANETEQREAAYLKTDYQAIQKAEPEATYNYALRINEASLTLSTIYRYARYDQDVISSAVELLQTRASYPDSTLSLVKLHGGSNLPPGIAAKRSDLETDFINTLPTNILAVRDLFDWQRTMWLGRLANFAQAMAKLDGEIKRRHKAKDREGEKKAKEALNLLLQQEPILGMKVALGDRFTFGLDDKRRSIDERSDMSFRTKDRPLYSWLNEVYQLPQEQIRCTANCPVLNYIGWSEPQARQARATIRRENELVETYGKKVLKRVLAQQDAIQMENGELFIPLSKIFDEELDDFPLGGVAGYFTYVAQIQEMDDENQEARYDLKVKDEVAFTLLQPAIKKLMETLKRDLTQISKRTLWDYHTVPQLRSYVLSTLSPALRTACNEIDKNEITHRKPYLQRHEAALDGFYLVSLVAQSLIKPQNGVTKALWWIGMRVAQGFYVANRFIVPSTHARDIANARTKTGLVTYETLALAQAQVSAAYTTAWLLFFELPVRYDYVASRFIHFVPKFCRSPLTQFHAFEFEIPSGQVVKGSLVRSGRWVRTAVGKMAESYSKVFREFVKISTMAARAPKSAATLQFGRALRQAKAATRLVKRGVLGEAAYNSSTSLFVQGISERVQRGPDFVNQPGFKTNMVITGTVDGATGFFAYARDLTVGQKFFAYGSTIFSLSILCQLSTGTALGWDVPKRAAYETVYILTLSEWKYKYAHNVREWGMDKIPDGGKISAKGLIMFRASDWQNMGLKSAREAYSVGIGMGNNFIGNSIYTMGTMKIFEGLGKVPNEAPLFWWAPHEKIPFWKKTSGS